MGRPPCCDKVGIKKGPWTPEEDILLVSYIQEHGPGNWRAVPTNTGLLRCSKSCRLRWTNYLRPGIKRGNFTPHEEGKIIHLQALLGNKWAAIATYLPQRTDNDIKNYWNTHLKKKLKKYFEPPHHDDQMPAAAAPSSDRHDSSVVLVDAANYNDHFTSSNSIKHSQSGRDNYSSVYASSAENISRLLEGWMRSSSSSSSSSPPQRRTTTTTTTTNNNVIITTSNYVMNENHDKFYCDFGKNIPTDQNSNSIQCYRPQQIDHDQFESILSGQEKVDHFVNIIDDDHRQEAKIENNYSINPPLSFLEKWLLDESAAGHEVEGVMELPSIF